MLAWMDLEMTGLEPERHVIVEIATVITDDDLRIIAEGPDLIVHATEEQLAHMDEVVVRMHTDSGLLEQIRSLAPLAGVRSNVIVGFPGETEDDLQTLCDFLVAARMDVTGVFGYSDEDGTEAAVFADDLKLDDDEIRARTEHVTTLVEELNAQRAEERIGEQVVVLVESVEDDVVEGRAAHQGPEVDGSTMLRGMPGTVSVGDLVSARVADADGADLVAEPIGASRLAELAELR